MSGPAKAPDSEFRDEAGRPLETKDVLAKGGGLPTLLAFFKTNCPTCQLMWPYLQRLHAAYGGKGVRVVGVSQNDAAASRAYYREFGNASFDLLLDLEPRFAASNAFGVVAVPHLVLLAPDGAVRKVFEGWQRTEMETLGAQIAAERRLPPVPVVPADDPVPSWKPG